MGGSVARSTDNAYEQARSTFQTLSQMQRDAWWDTNSDKWNAERAKLRSKKVRTSMNIHWEELVGTLRRSDTSLQHAADRIKTLSFEDPAFDRYSVEERDTRSFVQVLVLAACMMVINDNPEQFERSSDKTSELCLEGKYYDEVARRVFDLWEYFQEEFPEEEDSPRSDDRISAEFACEDQDDDGGDNDDGDELAGTPSAPSHSKTKHPLPALVKDATSQWVFDKYKHKSDPAEVHQKEIDTSVKRITF